MGIFKPKVQSESTFEVKPPDFDYWERRQRRQGMDSSGQRLPRFAESDGVWMSTDPGDARDGTVHLILAGDILCQERQIQSAMSGEDYNFHPSFKQVAPILRQCDLAVGNLEVPVCRRAPLRGEIFATEGHFYCNAPDEFVDAIFEAGFDAVYQGNNHALDAGKTGIEDTLALLDSKGMIHTGTFRQESDPRFVMIESKGIRIALLSYSTSYNQLEGNLTQKGRDVLLNQYAYQKAKKELEQAKAMGADYRIVFIHFGNEFTTQVSDRQRKIAGDLANLGCDYIVGSHAHVVQPYERITTKSGRKVPVVYSMGNFLAHHYGPGTKEGLLLHIRLNKDSAGVHMTDAYTPTYILSHLEGEEFVIVPAERPVLAHPEKERLEQAADYLSGILGPELPKESNQAVRKLPPIQEAARDTLQSVMESESTGKLAYVAQEDHAEISAYTQNGRQWFRVKPQHQGLPVTRMYDRLFENDSHIRVVDLGKNLEEIAPCAFRGCDALEGVRTRENLRVVGPSAFEGCVRLSGFVLPPSMKEIGAQAFRGCTELRGVKFLGSSLRIAPDAFVDCPGVVFYCAKGSDAHQYAKKHGLPCRLMEL